LIGDTSVDPAILVARTAAELVAEIDVSDAVGAQRFPERFAIKLGGEAAGGVDLISPRAVI
jgi:hypothetical protein